MKTRAEEEVKPTMKRCSMCVPLLPTLYDPMDGSPPDSVYKAFLVRILEWIAIYYYKGSNPHLLYLLHYRQILYH